MPLVRFTTDSAGWLFAIRNLLIAETFHGTFFLATSDRDIFKIRFRRSSQGW